MYHFSFSLISVNRNLNSIIFCVILSFISFSSKGQSVSNYQFVTNTTGSLQADKNGNPIDMSTGTTQLYGSNVTSYSAIVQNMFTFYFMGTAYTQFSVSPDGQLRFGPNPITGNVQTPVLGNEYLFLISSDNSTGPSGKVHYKIQNSSPNSVLIVEWNNLVLPTSGLSSSNYSTFQLRLYESSGIIEYVYGTMYNRSSSSLPISIGFSTSNEVGKIGQVTSITSTPAYSSNSASIINTSFTANSLMTNLNSAANGSRRVFQFTPAIPNAPSNIVANSITPFSMNLLWTDNSTNELGFYLYRSTNGVNYTLVDTKPQNFNASTQTNLSPGTNYIWRVYAYAEGGLSAPAQQTIPTNNCSTSGVKTIPGDYSSISAAMNSLSVNGVGGPLFLELQSNYNSSAEVFPIFLKSVPCASSVNTITIRPAAGVSTLITSNNFSSTIEIDGGNYWIIDGRSGGIGTGNLSITNTSSVATSSSIRLSNGASNNVIKYTSVSSTGTDFNTGVIYFASTTTNNGNSNNLIDHCSIDGNAGNTAAPVSNFSRNGIYSQGNSAGGNAANNNNIVSNNNIFNFYGTGITHTNLTGGWIISNNSFYQTSSRDNVGLQAIAANTTSTLNISNNYIGGSAPLCGGAPWTQLNGSNSFGGINAYASNNATATVQGNIITNINLTTTSSQPFYGIKTGCFNNTSVLNVTGNTIGNSAGTGSINLISSASQSISKAISHEPFPNAGSTSIVNNVIGSINISGTTTSVTHSFYSIYNLGNSSLIDHNIIGSNNQPLSINANTPAINGVQSIYGIYSTNGSSTISNNTVANLSNAYAPSFNSNATAVCGIYATGFGNITDNLIHDLFTSARATNVGGFASVIGIFKDQQNASGELSRNIVHSLYNTNTSANVSVVGIGYYSSSNNGSVKRNLIHNLNASSETALVSGIYASSVGIFYQNNMVRLGIDTNGNSMPTSCQINGIYEDANPLNANLNNKFYHNSIYIGGSVTGSVTSNSFSFKSVAASLRPDVRNNIFVNNRSNISGGGKHYVIEVNGTTPNPFGLNLNFNIYFDSGNGGLFGKYNSADVVSFASWKNAVGQDASSKFVSPCFINAINGIPDLHSDNCAPTGNPAEGNGVLISSVTDDFDGELRSGLTPTDIGADAGMFLQYVPVPFLGDYTSKTITTGGNTTVIPSLPPSGYDTISVLTSLKFTGILTIDPITGTVRITNAKPAGTYTVTVKADNVVKTFGLTVTNPVCSQADLSNVHNYDVSPFPSAVVVADFNGDGKQDYATVSHTFSQTPSVVSIMIGNGFGSFNPSFYTVGNYSTIISTGDFNNDGKIDLITNEYYNNKIAVHLGNGAGGFNGVATVSVGTNPTGIAVADFNGDGFQDVAVCNSQSNAISLRFGNGTGTLLGNTEINTGINSQGIIASDFNNDGIYDLATANYLSQSVSILIGNGAGGFSSLAPISMSGNIPVAYYQLAISTMIQIRIW